MTDLEIPYSFTAHTAAIAAQVNADFAAITTLINTTGVPKAQPGSITTGALATGAATSPKMAPTSATYALPGQTGIINSFTDLTGSTQTITPTVPSTALVWATLDMHLIPVGLGDPGDRVNETALGILQVDGSTQSGQIILGADLATTAGDAAHIRSVQSQHWRISLTAAAHTLKLMASTVGPNASLNIGAAHSKWSYVLFAQ